MKIPLGLCQCGCGRKTSIASKTDMCDGYRRGDRKLYVRGHSSNPNHHLDKAKIRAMMDEGRTAADVAKIVGVSEQRIYQVTGNLNRPNGARFRYPAQRKRIIENLSLINTRLRRGESLSAIARDLKVGVAALRRKTKVRRPYRWKEHGNPQAYAHGCRCRKCRAANAERGRNYRKNKREQTQ